MEKNRDLSNEPMHVRPVSLQQRSQDSALGRGESLQQTVLGKPDSHVQKNGTDRSLTLHTKISSKTLPWKPSGLARFLPPPRGEKQAVVKPGGSSPGSGAPAAGGKMRAAVCSVPRTATGTAGASHAPAAGRSGVTSALSCYTAGNSGACSA